MRIATVNTKGGGACEACGQPTRSSFGVCQRPGDCYRAYHRAWQQQARESIPRKPLAPCEVCGRLTDAAGGVCKMTLACRRERSRRYDQSQRGERNPRHPLYATWHAMIRRCKNPQATGYSYYGGRGITVCEAWLDAAAFIAWIEANLGSRPDGMTLDRVDPEGNYEPGNVRWATRRQQVLNRRRPCA